MKNKTEDNLQAFNMHLSEHKFIYKNIEIRFDELYKNLEKKLFPNDILGVDLCANKNYYILIDKKDDDNIFFFFNQLIHLELINGINKELKTKNICSTFEIISIIKEKKDFIFYFENVKVSDNCVITPNMIINNKITLIYFKNEFEKINFKNEYTSYKISDDKIYPLKLDNNFYSYFPEQKETDNIKYIRTQKRDNLDVFIRKYLSGKSIIKLTGPSGIGKSFFLLYLARKSSIYLYLNLAALYSLYLQKEPIKFFNMIINEINRLEFNQEIATQLNEIINKNIENYSINSIVKNLIEFFISKKLKIKIILDQFKLKYFDNWDEIEKCIENNNKNLKVIICSSINNKDIGDSVSNFINSCFYKKDKKYDNFNNNHINDYFYISNLLEETSLDELSDNKVLDKKENNIKENICKYFGKIPKYVLEIKNSNNLEETTKKIKNRIKNKLNDFYNSENGEDNLLTKLPALRRFIGYKIPTEEFKDIPKFSYKYFIIRFFNDDEEIDILQINTKINYFQIDYLFIYISEIVEELILKANELFFKQTLYKEHTGATIGGFFELITINQIENNFLELPEGKIDFIIRMDRINEMREVKPRIKELLSNELKLLSAKKDAINLPEKEIKTETIPKNAYIIQETEKLFNFEKKYIIEDNKIEEIKNNFLEKNNIDRNDISNKILIKRRITKNNPNIEYQFIESKDNNNKKYHYLKDKNILITQLYQNAATYDLAYIYGKSEEKIFVGFQMKSYRDYDDRTRTFSFSRENIIEKSKLLLFNSKYHFGVNIVELNYIIVGLYFSDDKSEKEINYSNDLIRFCTNNKFKLILYDPFKNTFFDSNKKEIKKIDIPDKFANVLEEESFRVFSFIKPYNCFLQKKRKRDLSIELFGLVKQQKNLKEYELNNEFIEEAESFVNKIKDILQLEDVKYMGSDSLKQQNILLAPEENYLFLFEKKVKKKNELLNGLQKFYGLFKVLNNNEEIYYVFDFKSSKVLNKGYLFEYYCRFNISKEFYVFKFKK